MFGYLWRASFSSGYSPLSRGPGVKINSLAERTWTVVLRKKVHVLTRNSNAIAAWYRIKNLKKFLILEVESNDGCQIQF